MSLHVNDIDEKIIDEIKKTGRKKLWIGIAIGAAVVVTGSIVLRTAIKTQI